MKKFTRVQKIARLIRFNYYKLLRSPEGAGKVARGFAVGFGLEIILPYTLYAGYILMIPFVYMFRASLPASVFGNLLCKITFLPLILVPLGNAIGKRLPLAQPHFMTHMIYRYLKTLLGLSIMGLLLGVVSYFVIYALYEFNRSYRLKKRLGLSR